MGRIEIETEMFDWRTTSGAAAEFTPEEAQPWTVKIEQKADRITLEFSREEDVRSIDVEINHGVPAVYLSTDGTENILHAFMLQEGVFVEEGDGCRTVTPHHQLFANNSERPGDLYESGAEGKI